MADTRRLNSIVEPDMPEDPEELRKKVEDYERWFATMDQQIYSLERERQKLSSLVKYSDAGALLFDTESMARATPVISNPTRSTPGTGRPSCRTRSLSSSPIQPGA